LLIYSFYAIQYHNTTYKQLTSVLAIAVLAAILSYFSQRTIFPYHIYPILAFDCLLSTLLLGCYISAGINNNNHAYSLIGFLIAALVIFFSHFLDYALFICVLFPQYFFGFFILVLVFMLYFSGSHKINFIIGPLIVISGGLLVRHLAMATDSGTFIALMLYLTCLFLLLGRKTNINTSHFMISATLVTLFFVFPYVDRLYLYQVRLLKDKEFRTLIAFTDRYAVHHSVYFFSTLIEHVPVVDYCKDTTTAMRLPFFWMLPAMVRQGETTPNYISDKHFLINMITEDFRNKKPYLVFVDVSKHKPFLFSPKTNEYAHFEFLPFFLSETTFAEEWKKYHYLTSVKFEGHKTDVELDSDRKFAVYQRSDI